MIRDIEVGNQRVVHTGTFLIPEGQEARFTLWEDDWSLPIIIFWGSRATPIEGTHINWKPTEDGTGVEIHYNHVPEQRSVVTAASKIANLADGKLHFLTSAVRTGKMLTLTICFFVTPNHAT